MSAKHAMTEVALFKDLAQQFQSLLNDPVIFEEREVFKNGILKAFDHNKLPQSFRAYVDEVFKKKAPVAWLKSHFSGIESSESKLAYFGSQVKDA